MTVALFWDIDGTLLTTARAGVYSLEDALEQVTGRRADLQDLATAGMTDWVIAGTALRAVDATVDEETVQRFLDVHSRQLPSYLDRRRGHVLSGVREALEMLECRNDATNLLLTGNVEAGAWAKLAHYGLDRFFRHGGAFCVGAGDRADIARRALPLAGDAQPYVIGDTPADVACGHAIGARTIAVATGTYSLDELRASEAWAAFEQLPPPPELALLLGLDDL